MERARIYIDGMTCISCQNRIETELKRNSGITDVYVSYEKGEAVFWYDPAQISFKHISDMIENIGYRVSLEKYCGKKRFPCVMGEILLILVLFALLQYFGLLNYLVPSSLADSEMGYGMLFVVGVLTSVHCIAMCGGIHLSQTLQKEITEKITEKMFRNSLFYNVGRMVSYTVTGAVLGAVGGLVGLGTDLQMSSLLQGFLKLAAGIIMIFMGINMLGIFPGLRKIGCRVPFLPKRKRTKNRAPFIAGLCNGLMPCGPLQSVQIIALATANPLTGALCMLSFSAGTVLLMLGFGSAIALLGKRFTAQVLKAGSILIVVMGLSMLAQGSSLMNFKFIQFPLIATNSLQKIQDTAIEKNGTQYVYSELQSGKYPDITVKAGEPVIWEIEASENHINGCNYKIIQSELGVEHSFTEGKNTITFTPAKSGTYTYTCWMGMITGKIYVKDQ